MEEYTNGNSPILNTKGARMGDFVHWLMPDTQPSFGVVTGIFGDNIQIRYFEDGFPSELLINPKHNTIRKASRDKSLTHFHQISKEFERNIEVGGLLGALLARKQHYIKGVISQLEQSGWNSFYATTIPPQDPMTGTYVLMGVYSGHGPSEHLEGIVAVPRLSEVTVSKIMKDTNPNGFGRIPNKICDTAVTSHGSLAAYWVYEVPKEQIGFVENPKRLELRLE